MSHKLKLFIGVLALLSLPVLSACNTGSAGTAGVNQDMQAAGEGRAYPARTALSLQGLRPRAGVHRDPGVL